MSKTYLILMMTLAAAATTWIAMDAHADRDKDVDLKDVPATVRETLLKHAKGHEIVELEMKKKGGNVFYEAEIVVDGKEVDLQVSADGTFLGKEMEEHEDNNDDEEAEEISAEWADLPSGVKHTLETDYGHVTFQSFGMESDDGVVFYEAAYSDSETKREIKLTAEGEIVETEAELAYTALPGVVQEAISSRFAGAKSEGAERVQVNFYEVELETRDGKKIEVRVLANGQFLDDEDDDDEDDDDEN